MIHHPVPHEKLSLFKTRSVSVGKPTMDRIENIQNSKINNQRNIPCITKKKTVMYRNKKSEKRKINNAFIIVIRNSSKTLAQLYWSSPLL